MRDDTPVYNPLPDAVGVGYKPQHFDDILATPGPVKWLEVHAENYMGQGGRPIAQLRALSEKFAISVHGVGLSIGGEGPLDAEHLHRVKHLVDWLNPASFSEHLAWSSHGGEFLNDLLPLPYTAATLRTVSEHIDHVQTTLGRQMLLENPSSYLAFETSTFSEVQFLTELVERTGCGLLLDVNNVFISATNLSFTPQDYIDAYPTDEVKEIHVGGHVLDHDDHGAPLLIDTHGAATSSEVWHLLAYTLTKSGPKPLLVEWDNDVPDWDVLHAEACLADRVLTNAAQS